MWVTVMYVQELGNGDTLKEVARQRGHFREEDPLSIKRPILA